MCTNASKFSEVKRCIEMQEFTEACRLLQQICMSGSLLTNSELKLARTLQNKIPNKRDNSKSVPFSKEWNDKSWYRLSEKIRLLEKIKVLIINDNGFNAGAGIGAGRQAQCFLAGGWDVVLASTHPEPKINLAYSKRYGIENIKHICLTKDQRVRKPISSDEIVDLIIKEEPDLIVTGNFHSSGIELTTIEKIHTLKFPIVVYAHDCDWVTGGCAHFLYHNCNLFAEGCLNEGCPKSNNSYPPLRRPVYESWLERSKILGPTGIPIFANSRWTKGVFEKRFVGKKDIFLNHLSIDTKAFQPKDKFSSRQRFNLDHEKFVILAGSSTFSTRGKGGDILHALFHHFRNDTSIVFVYFGHSKNEHFPENVKPLGYISGEDDLCDAYNASDIFLNPVSIESFGQTMLEAAACGVPILGLKTTGVPDILHHGLNGFFCKEDELSSFVAAINSIRHNPSLKENLSHNSRIIAENLFSHEKIFGSWRENLIDICFKKRIDRRLSTSNSISKCKKLSGSNNLSGCFLDKKKLLTIITPTFNVGDEFIRTAESILEQDTAVEWIIIDGKSTNISTRQLLDGYSKIADKYISEEDEGIYDAMNKSLNYCSGDYVLFMGSGDFLSSSNTVRTIIRSLTNRDMLIGNVVEVRISGGAVKTKSIDPLKKLAIWRDKNDLTPPLQGMPPHQATIIRLDILKKYMFNRKYKVCADWDQIFKICSHEKNLKVAHIDNVISWYPNGGFSASISDQWLQEASKIISCYSSNDEKYKEFFLSALTRQYGVIAKRQTIYSILNIVDIGKLT